MTPLEQFKRRQRLLRDVLKKIDLVRLSSALDETFYASLREAMLAAGATDDDLDWLSGFQVSLIMQSTRPGSEEREEQFELIAHHLSQTDMHVRVGKNDSFVFVEFPSRRRVH